MQMFGAKWQKERTSKDANWDAMGKLHFGGGPGRRLQGWASLVLSVRRWQAWSVASFLISLGILKELLNFL